MKVLITTSIFPPDIGGPATYVPVMAQALLDRGHDVAVYTGSDRATMADTVTYPFEVVRVNRERSRPARAFSLLWSCLRGGRPADVVFGNSTSMLEPALASRLLRKPYVLKVVGDGAWETARRRGWTELSFDEFQETRTSARTEVLRRLRTWHARQARSVIVPSRFLATVVERWGIPEARIRVVYNATTPSNGTTSAKVLLDTAVKLITVGRLVHWKRVDEVIRVTASLKDAGLVIVGDGPERHRLESLARDLGVADRVVFAGQSAREETMGLLAASDAFVLNSTYEGLPHTVVEAMEMGVAVVATAAGGTSEVVDDGETGLLVEPGNREDLERALVRITGDGELRRRLSLRGRQVVRERFAVNTMVDKTEQVLRRAVSETAM